MLRQCVADGLSDPGCRSRVIGGRLVWGDGSGGTVDGHQLAGVQAGGGVAGADHGGDAVLAGDQGGVGGEGAAVGDDRRGLREQRRPRRGGRLRDEHVAAAKPSKSSGPWMMRTGPVARPAEPAAPRSPRRALRGDHGPLVLRGRLRRRSAAAACRGSAARPGGAGAATLAPLGEGIWLERLGVAGQAGCDLGAGAEEHVFGAR